LVPTRRSSTSTIRTTSCSCAGSPRARCP